MIEELDDAAAPSFGRSLIVDAVGENVHAKRTLIEVVGAVFGNRDYVLCMTSSYLPLCEVLANFEPKNAANIVQVRLFHPIASQTLCEMTYTESSSRDSLASVADYMLSTGKAIVNSGDKCGFVASRLITSFGLEALLLIREGLDPYKLEEFTKDIGFPFGVLSMIDVLGLDVFKDIYDNISTHNTYFAEYDINLVKSLLERNCKGKAFF